MKAITTIVLLLLSGTAAAIDTDIAFEDPAMQARYEAIIEEVRCVKCQNQTIKDSNALIANDLRREIRRLMGEGMSDAEIYDFLVERYGEFVLYRPRMSGVSLLLWIAPGIFLLAGGFVFVRVLRKRMSMPFDLDDEFEA
ncbi:MAG: cytochrome c-type biogenesis protein CcmH, partial [Gammaproteobacteria bacterium]|nr:cytochrome c-type biogenesis protein CcmH [Gammaproteobacteria bacterium]